MDTAITEKQRNLLVNSEIIQEADNRKLYRYLKRHKRMSISELRQPPLSKIARRYEELLYESRLEWVGDEREPVRDLGARYKHRNQRCELCGYGPVRYEYVLVNRRNGNRLSIGSECIREFDKILQRHLLDELRKLKAGPKAEYGSGNGSEAEHEEKMIMWEPVWRPQEEQEQGDSPALLHGKRQVAISWDEWVEKGPSHRQQLIEQKVEHVFSKCESITKQLVGRVIYMIERK